MDWVWGLLGGLMIGSAAALFLLGNGRIMGASGIIGRVIERKNANQMLENLAFLGAMIAAPVIVLGWGWLPETQITDNWLVIISAGLCVGVGTRLANGCTSGHGVCGMSRLSMRGILASCIYIAAGVVSVGLFRHVLGLI